MHWIQLVDHWLWLSMAQSNWSQLLPRVQSAPLLWVGDHNYSLLIYIFGHLYILIYQCESTIKGDDNVGLMSHTFFHQDVPLLGRTIWQYQLPLIRATQFFNWVEWDLSYNRWYHQCHHPVVSWHNCLAVLLIEQAVVCPVAAIHECVHNSTDFDLDMECQVSWDSTQYILRHHCHKDQSILALRNTLCLLPC